MKKNLMYAGWMLLSLGISFPAQAAQTASAQQVTISVPNINEITSERDTFTLDFKDFIPGSETNTELITYTIKANALNRTEGVIQAKVETTQPGMAIQANVGSYAKTGGDASLVASQSGFTTVGSSWVNLADRRIDAGLGNTAIGSLPISYKAVAEDYLDARSVTIQMSVVLVDV